MDNNRNRTRIVILGAGYGGIVAAQGLSKKIDQLNVDITLVNRHSYHQMLTKLHEPAGGQTEGNEIRIPIHRLVKGIRIIKDSVESIEPEVNKVILQKQEIEYDYLVIALGSDPEYFDIPGLEKYGYPLRSLNAARLIKAQIESCLAQHKVAQLGRGQLTFVVGGAGFTGVELAGELSTWLPTVAPKYDIKREKIKLLCVEAADSVLPGADPYVSSQAEAILRNQGVDVRLGMPIKEVEETQMIIGDETIPYKMLIWTGGVRGNSVLEKSGFSTRRGRANINEYLQSINYKNVFIIGDSSIYIEENGRALPPTAQLAMQQGKHLIKNIASILSGKNMQPFKFIDRGVVASIGPNDAVGIVYRKYRMKGLTAVWMKKIIHYRYLFIIGGVRLVLQDMFGILSKRNAKEE